MSQHKQANTHNKIFSKKRLVPLVFFFIFPPAAVAILIYDLLTETKECFYTSTQNAPFPIGSRTVAIEAIDSSIQNKSLSFLNQKRKNLLFWGSLLVILCGFSTVLTFYNGVHGATGIVYLISDILSTIGGFVLLYLSQRLNQKIHHHSKYFDAIGNNHNISISALASATQLTEQQVRLDLQEMLTDGCFQNGIFDCGNDHLILP